MRLLGALGLPLAVVATGGMVLWEAAGLGRFGRAGELGPGFWPLVWSAVYVAAGMIGVSDGVARWRGRAVKKGGGVVGKAETGEGLWWRWLWATGITVVYFFAVERIGFLWATVIGLSGFAALEDGLRRKWWLLCLFGVFGGLGMAWVFVGILGSSLPVGTGIWGGLTEKVYRVVGIWRF
jgi:hypothetical protein